MYVFDFFGLIIFVFGSSCFFLNFEQLYRLTFWTRHSSKIRLDLEDDNKDKSSGKQPGNNDLSTNQTGDSTETISTSVEKG